MTVLGIVTGFGSEARILSGLTPLVSAVGGNGGRAYEQALDLVARGARTLLSAGIAGGLDPSLATGTLVVGRKVRSVEGVLACHPDLADLLVSRLTPCVDGGVAYAELPIDTPLAKRSLFRGCGALAVDMESWGVAKAALESGVPFGILRVVADPAGRALPPAALVGLDKFGKVRAGRVIRALMGSPGQIPALIRVAMDTNAALAALGDAVKRLRGVI